MGTRLTANAVVLGIERDYYQGSNTNVLGKGYVSLIA